MRASRWLTGIGVVESLLALWGIGGGALVAISGGIVSVAAVVSTAALLILGGMLLTGGVRLVRGDARGISLSITTLTLLTVKLALPGVVWCVNLGWSVDLVLYAGGPSVPDSQLSAVWIGHTGFPGFLAVNLLPLALLGGLLVVRRATSAAPAPTTA